MVGYHEKNLVLSLLSSLHRGRIFLPFLCGPSVRCMNCLKVKIMCKSSSSDTSLYFLIAWKPLFPIWKRLHNVLCVCMRVWVFYFVVGVFFFLPSIFLTINIFSQVNDEIFEIKSQAGRRVFILWYRIDMFLCLSTSVMLLLIFLGSILTISYEKNVWMILIFKFWQ